MPETSRHLESGLVSIEIRISGGICFRVLVNHARIHEFDATDRKYYCVVDNETYPLPLRRDLAPLLLRRLDPFQRKQTHSLLLDLLTSPLW